MNENDDLQKDLQRFTEGFDFTVLEVETDEGIYAGLKLLVDYASAKIDEENYDRAMKDI